jgi:C4-dicarboxylate-specific signal transduction histidine kinase
MVEEALHRSARLVMPNRYAGAIMHEVNNPLEHLSNLVFLTTMISSDEKVLENMEIEESQLKRLGDVTRKSLDFYGDELEAKEFDLMDIVESALTVHAHRMRKPKVEIRKRFWVPATAKVFAGEIHQVISNLLLNSLDAVPESEAVVSVRVRSSPMRVHITVSDTGAGIEPAVFKNLFRANQTIKANGTGSACGCRRALSKSTAARFFAELRNSPTAVDYVQGMHPDKRAGCKDCLSFS